MTGEGGLIAALLSVYYVANFDTRQEFDNDFLSNVSPCRHRGLPREHPEGRRVPERGQESRRRVRAKGLSFDARRHSGMSSPPSCFSLPADA